MPLQKYLTVILLLVVVLLAPFNSFAHEAGSLAVSDACACSLGDNSPDRGSHLPDHCPGSTADDCCDCAGCSPDAAAPAMFAGLRVNIFVKQHFQPYTNGYPPEVILAIFVPPESRSLT